MLKELENLLAEIARQQGIDVPQKQPSRQPAATRRHAEHEPMDAIIVEAEPVREDIFSHVARTVDTSDITQNVSHLGADVGHADDRMDARVHERFDRQLSQINDRAYGEQEDESVGAASSEAAFQVADVFRNPLATRQAIILNEILTRPTDRW